MAIKYQIGVVVLFLTGLGLGMHFYAMRNDDIAEKFARTPHVIVYHASSVPEE